MAVWGNALYIHSTDTLSLLGNLYLLQANVQGAGALLLHDTKRTEIQSINSSLAHMVVATTDTVTLLGELEIRQGLAILHGVFDTRTATLCLGDTAGLNIAPQGQWLRSPPPVSYSPGHLPSPIWLGGGSGHYACLEGPAASPPRAMEKPQWRSGAPPRASLLPSAGWKRLPSPPPR